MADNDLEPKGDERLGGPDDGKGSLSPKEQADFDQIESGYNDQASGSVSGSGPSQNRSGGGSRLAARFKSITSKAGKRKGLIIGGGAGILGIIALAAFLFFFLSLFKLNHIEKLFVDYEFAMLHRSMSERANEALGEAKGKAQGNEDTKVSEDAPLEEQMTDANAEMIDNATSDQSNLSEQSRLMQEGDKIVTGDVVDPEFGAVPNVEEVDESKSEDDQAKQASDDFEKSVQGSDDAGTAPAGLDDEVDAVKKDIKDNHADPQDAMDKALKASPEDMISGVAKFNKFMLISTLSCIVYDIFHQEVDKFANLKSGELVREATSTYAAADAQKEGKLNATQIGAIQGKFDNDKEQFTDSAAYQRVANPGKPINDPKNDLPEAAHPFAVPGGVIGQIVSFFAGKGILGAAADQFCQKVLDPKVQVVAAIIAVAGLVGGETEVTDVVTQAVGQAALVFAGAAGLKYLVSAVVMNYAGAAATGTSHPIQMGNQVDAGTDVLSQEYARQNGGRQLGDQEAHDMKQVALKAVDLQDRQQGLAYYWVSPSNPRSLLSRALMQTPSSPSAAVASVFRNFASMFNPAAFITLSGRMTLAFSNPAFAADNIKDPYGIPQYGLSDGELNRWKILDNAKWVEDRNKDKSLSNKYDKCFDKPIGEVFAGKGIKSNDYGFCDDKNNEELAHYRMYRFDKRVVQNMVLLGNKQAYQAPGTFSNPSAGAPSGDVQELAKQILANPNVYYPLDGSSPNGKTKDVLQALANGQPAPVYCSNAGRTSTDVNPNILKFILDVASQGRIGVNAITDKCHTAGSNHYTGQAVDIDNGSPNTGLIIQTANKYGGTKNGETSHMHFDFPLNAQ